MTVEQFLSLFRYICDIFWYPIRVIFSVPLANGIDFGDILLIIIILAMVLFIIFRPIKK